MNSRHALVISSFLALALVLGAASVLRTTSLGASATAPKLTERQIATKKHQLARYERQLRQAARQKPPALPKLPPLPPPPSSSTAPALTPIAATSSAASVAPRTIYVRPKPIVRILHRHHDGDGGDHEGGHEAGGDGGGFDD